MSIFEPGCSILTTHSLFCVAQPFSPSFFQVPAFGAMFGEPIMTLWLGEWKPDANMASAAVTSAVASSLFRKLTPLASFDNKSTHSKHSVKIREEEIGRVA